MTGGRGQRTGTEERRDLQESIQMSAFQQWAGPRLPLLSALGVLFLAVAVVIVVSMLRG